MTDTDAALRWRREAMDAILTRYFGQGGCNAALRRLNARFDGFRRGWLDASAVAIRGHLQDEAARFSPDTFRHSRLYVSAVMTLAFEAGLVSWDVAFAAGVDPLLISPARDVLLRDLTGSWRSYRTPPLRRLAIHCLLVHPARGPLSLTADEVTALFDSLLEVGTDVLPAGWDQRSRKLHRWSEIRRVAITDREVVRALYAGAFRQGLVARDVAEAAGVRPALLVREHSETWRAIEAFDLGGRLEIDWTLGRVSWNRDQLRLEHGRCLGLLATLASRPRELIPGAELAPDLPSGSRAHYASALRRSLADAGSAAPTIDVIPRQGWRLIPAGQPDSAPTDPINHGGSR